MKMKRRATVVITLDKDDRWVEKNATGKKFTVYHVSIEYDDMMKPRSEVILRGPAKGSMMARTAPFPIEDLPRRIRRVIPSSFVPRYENR